jgi:hypothetical protein
MAEENYPRRSDRVVVARDRAAVLAPSVGAPWATCSCHDHCDGDYGGPHCNADLGGYIDAVIAATRHNPSTACYLDLHCDRVAGDLDGDPDRDNRPDGNDSDPAATDPGPAAARPGDGA